MLGHDEVWDAIDALAARHGLSPSGLARRSGLDPTTFNKSKRRAPGGRPRWPSTESIAKILKATNTHISDLFGMDAREVAMREGLAVPLLGSAHAGFEIENFGSEEPIMVPMPARIINFPDSRYEPLYALSVVGESMEPLYRDGDILFIAPQVEVNTGDRVIVKLHSNDLMVKILKSRDVNAFTFRAVNPEHPDLTCTAESVDWIARIVYVTQ